MPDFDLIDYCYDDGSHGGVVKVEKAAKDSFRVSNIAEVLVVVHFSTREHYEYVLESGADNIDAYAQEYWQWQRRDVHYRVARDGGVVERGVDALRRVFEDRLCHWIDPEKESPNNRKYPELSLWSDKPGDVTEDWAEIDFEDSEYHVLVDDLNADETDRSDSYGRSGINYFELLSEGAKAAAEDAGLDPYDPNELWDHYSFTGTRYGQEPVSGVSGFGIAFKDGSYLVQSSTHPKEIDGNGVFQNVMARFVEELVTDESEATKLVQLLSDPVLETRLKALERLAAFG